MFDNIGGKIKALAQVVCWIGIIASVICGIMVMAVGEAKVNLVGFLILILGSLFSWIGSFMTYGFGQLIENSSILVAEKTNNTSTSNGIAVPVNNRIHTLNKLKKQGLITEEEYNQKVENLK